MVVMPCSMSTVGRLAAGLSGDLLERAADVQLKEGRRLVIVPRETPFSLIHLRNLTTLAEAGARIVPAIPAWYHNPETIEDLVDFVVARALDQLGIDCVPLRRWQGHLPP
jgi:4-hydroxy-3-polyprenylbenzoate decarboxylase